MRLESSPDRAFATAWTGSCCQEGRTALGIMTTPHKLGQSHEEEDIEFAAEHHREPRCAFDDCPLPPYQDEHSQTHACCSKSHERLRQAGWTRNQFNVCAISECDRVAHRDETGFTHPCCSKSHANKLDLRTFLPTSVTQEVSAESVAPSQRGRGEPSKSQARPRRTLLCCRTGSVPRCISRKTHGSCRGFLPAQRMDSVFISRRCSATC